MHIVILTEESCILIRTPTAIPINTDQHSLSISTYFSLGLWRLSCVLRGGADRDGLLSGFYCTLLPLLPDFSVPFLRRRISVATVFEALFPYLRPRDLVLFLAGITSFCSLENLQSIEVLRMRPRECRREMRPVSVRFDERQVLMEKEAARLPLYKISQFLVHCHRAPAGIASRSWPQSTSSQRLRGRRLYRRRELSSLLPASGMQYCRIDRPCRRQCC